MSRKPGSQGSSKKQEVVQGKYWLPTDAAWGGFINLRLDDADVEEFQRWELEHGGDADAMLDDLIGEGMKFGLSYDRENQCYVTTLTGKGWEACLERYCLTTRAGTVQNVLALTMWKHFVHCGGWWGDFLPSTGKLKQWG